METTVVDNLASQVEDIDIEQIDNEIEEELKTNVTVAIQTEVLKSLIGKVERSVAKKAVNDIYKFIYLEFQPEEIIARAVNNDYMTEAVIEQNMDKTNYLLKSGKPGAVCFPAEKLVPIVKRLKAKNSSITIQDNHAVIKSGRPEFELSGVDGHQFPRFPDIEESECTLTIDAAALSNVYDHTIYAASTKETRPILTGVNHRIENKRLICVSTDSHRLAQHVHDLDNDYPEIDTCIPVTVLSEAKRHLDAMDGKIRLHFCSSKVVYEFGDVTMFGRTLEGKYPETDRLLFTEEQAGASFVVHAGTFKNLLNNATAYDTNAPIIFKIVPELNQLRAEMSEAEVGEFREDLSVIEGKGESFAVAVNVNYLLEALARYNNEDYIQFIFMPSSGGKYVGMQPFSSMLHRGNKDCVELFVPVRTSRIDYAAEVTIEDFEGAPEFDFNPFEEDFEEIS